MPKSFTTVIWRLPALTLGAISLLCVEASQAETALPRYWPKVGQELSYRTRSEFSTADGQTLQSESTWQVWVVRQNKDGTWRLVFRHASTMHRPAAAARPAARMPSGKPSAAKPGAGKTAPARPAAPAKPAPGRPAAGKGTTAKPSAKPPTPTETLTGALEQVTFAYCDFSADGAVAANPTLGFQFEPRQLLPKLPGNKKELDKGWSDFDQATQIGYRYRVEGAPAGSDDDDDDDNDDDDALNDSGSLWKIVATRQNPVEDIYLSRSRSTFLFNGDLGVVKRVESKLEQGYGFAGTQLTITELVGIEQFDAAWCKRLDEEMGHYFAVQRRYQDLLKAAERSSADAETLLIEAGVLLQKAAADITLPLVKEDLGKQVAQHAGMIGFVARAARDRSDLIDLPAQSWQTKDLDGDAHSLRDYKKKVVLLYFWKRGDLWSLRTLPQIERIAERFADQPVVVLGMNTDANEQDARFVVEKMGLAFPILRADKFADKYNAASATLIVIDQKGVVRDVYARYSPTLVDDVAKVVSGLLEKGDTDEESK